MSTPVKKVNKKPQERTRDESAPKNGNGRVRPDVAKLIKKVVSENAPTWEELAKR
jgi:hypothetical protein